MKNIVIIGAGPAGLTAALELLKKPEAYSVTILEQSDRIGGISQTVRHNGHRMDLGGHRFFSKDARVNELWQQLLPIQGAPAKDDISLGRDAHVEAGGPDPECCDEVFLYRHRVSRIYYKRKFFDYPISMKPATFKNMGLAATIAAGFSYVWAQVFKRKEDSLEDFYINRFGKKLYSMFFEGYTEKLWGRHPSCISADWGAQRVKGLSILAVLKDALSKLLPSKKARKVETSLIEEFIYPKYGPGQLWETAAARISEQGGKVLFHCRVKRFETDENGIAAVICETPDGEQRFAADEVISSMPLADLVAGMPDAPQDIRRIAGGLPYRDFVTIGLLLPRLALKNETAIKTWNDQVPDCWIYVQDPGVTMGRIQIFNNWSPYLVADPEHTVWVGLEYFCQENDDFWNMTDEAAVALALRELERMGVIDAGTLPLDTHRERVQKAYPAYFDTYSEIDTLIGWLDTIPNLYCVGRNGQHRYNNMDHSMMTAFETVDNLNAGKTDRTNIWNVNTEQDYHETDKTKEEN